MARRVRDPYQVLEVSRDASDDALRAAYRRLVKLHHPDHNGGSLDAARRFEEVQQAYAQIVALREAAAAPKRTPAPDPEMDSRLADLERQVREALDAKERAMRAAAEANARTQRRPSDEELGYVRTDDTLSKWLDDARTEFSQRMAGAGGEGGAGGQNARGRAADLLEELAARLRGEDPKR